MKLGIVVGLLSEKSAIGEIGHPVEVSGADAERAYEGACRLADDGAEALVSFGLAGALVTNFEPGTLLLPSSVITKGGAAYRAHPLNNDEVSVHQRAPLFGSDVIIDSAEQKAQLAEQYQAGSVDMESHAVARAAVERHLPFYVIRAVADPANQALPPSAQGAVAPDGSVNTWHTIKQLFSRPGDLPELIALGRQSSAALKTLSTQGRGFLMALSDA